jgi:hypothetical protein
MRIFASGFHEEHPLDTTSCETQGLPVEWGLLFMKGVIIFPRDGEWKCLLLAENKTLASTLPECDAVSRSLSGSWHKVH